MIEVEIEERGRTSSGKHSPDRARGMSSALRSTAPGEGRRGGRPLWPRCDAATRRVGSGAQRARKSRTKQGLRLLLWGGGDAEDRAGQHVRPSTHVEQRAPGARSFQQQPHPVRVGGKRVGPPMRRDAPLARSRAARMAATTRREIDHLGARARSRLLLAMRPRQERGLVDEWLVAPPGGAPSGVVAARLRKGLRRAFRSSLVCSRV